MTDSDETKPISTQPLTPEPGDGKVVVENPPAEPLVLTPDAAEISGLRLIEASDKARADPRKV